MAMVLKILYYLIRFIIFITEMRKKTPLEFFFLSILKKQSKIDKNRQGTQPKTAKA